MPLARICGWPSKVLMQGRRNSRSRNPTAGLAGRGGWRDELAGNRARSEKQPYLAGIPVIHQTTIEPNRPVASAGDELRGRHRTELSGATHLGVAERRYPLADDQLRGRCRWSKVCLRGSDVPSTTVGAEPVGGSHGIKPLLNEC